jgi:cysteine desulfurase
LSVGGSALLYFDHNATSPLSETARAVWLETAERFIGNPSSPHRLGARADAALEGAREKLSAWLGCSPSEIVWTSGATESINTVFAFVAHQGSGGAWVSAVEHPCVLQAAERWFPGRCGRILVSTSGVVEFERIRSLLDAEKPALGGGDGRKQ